MSNRVGPALAKWPFFLADFLLVGLAFFIVRQSPSALNLWQASVCLAAMIAGAWFCVHPFLREHEAALRLDEAGKMASTVAQIGNLEQIKTQIINATDQWRTMQNHSNQSITAARELADRMQSELTEFRAFLTKANDTEKAHLKLEVEKLRRGEGDWLQTSVHILDHVFALHRAAGRSGNSTLLAQMDQFQFACRDIVRKLGLVPIVPLAKEPFNANTQQVPEGSPALDSAALVGEILAPGYTYQGQLVRKALILAETGQSSAPVD